MARQVTGVSKDQRDNITSICGNGWRHSTHEAILNMQVGTDSYYVSVNGQRVAVHARPRNAPTYLTTSADGYAANNLDNLGPC